MASGSFSNNVGQNCNLIISWNSVKGQGGSTVNATLIAQNRNGWYFDAVVYGYGITINGSQVTGTGARLSASSNGSAGLISHSVWVPYTGDKSITISGYANFNGIINLSNQSISGTVALDKIGSAPTMGSVTAPTTSTVSEKTTSITVRWNKASSYNNSVTYAIGCSINGGSYEWRYPDNNINTTSYTWDIGTPTQGATYKFAVCCANDIARSDYKYSGVVTINELSPPTIGDIGTYNPYTNSTLTIPLSGGSTTNGENFVRMCDLYYGDTWLCNAKSYADTPWKNTSQDISYAAANYVSKLGTKAYSSNKFKITAWIENANRSRSSYVSKTFTVNINSDGGATPTLSPPTLSGGAFNNAATCFIAGISTLNVSSPAASLRRAPSGTTISYKIACTGATTQNSQNANFSGLTAGTKTITVTATDSRGLSVSVSKQVVVQSYAAPTIRAFTATRLDDPNTSAKLVYTLAYSPIYQYTDVDTKGNQLNGISLQQYKKDNFDWTTASNELVLTNLETDSTYTIQLRIADKVNTTTYVTGTQVIPTIKTTMAWRSWGVGIGCIPQNGYNLDVTGKARFTTGIESPVNTSSYLNGSKGVNVLVNSTATGANYKTFLSGPSTNGRFSLSMYQDRVLVGYQAQSSIDSGTNALTKYIQLLQEDGTSVFNTIRCADGLHVGSTFGAGDGTITGISLHSADGGIELSGATPYIDFHYNNTSSDHTHRIIADGNYLSIHGDIRASSNTLLNGSMWAGNVYVPTTSSEWLGFYKSDRSTRYCWIGRNGSSNTKFYFTGEDNVDNFYFNKPITHPGMKYSISEQWTGEYWIDGKKIYTKTFEYEKTGTGQQSYVTDLKSDTVDDPHFDLQNSFFSLKNSEGQWEFKPLNSPSGNGAYTCESLIYKNQSTKQVIIKTTFGQSLLGSKYIKATIRYCKL